MKILIAYYSRTDSTHKVAEKIKENLEKRGHFVYLERIRAEKEHSFFGWQFIRAVKSRCNIKEPKTIDVSGFDVVCFGSPNWTRLSLPMVEYIRKVKGLKNKKVGLFFTSGFPEAFEYFIFSGYLLNLTANNEVEKKGGRVIDTIIFSSLIKKWNYLSPSGKEKIGEFCDKIENLIFSIKNHLLERREKAENQFLSVIFTSLFFLILLSHLYPLGLTTLEYVFFYFTTLTGFVAMQTKLSAVSKKYIGACFLVIIAITPVMIMPEIKIISPIWYFLALLLIMLLKDAKVLIISGLVGSVMLLSSFFLYPEDFTNHLINFSIFSLMWIVLAFLAFIINKELTKIFDQEEELESSREELEVKIKARIKELQEKNKEKEVMDLEKEILDKKDN